jgi:hypothetical protein
VSITGSYVGASFSAGVDSFYTLMKHTEVDYLDYRVTHILFANVGALTKNPLEAQRVFKQKAARFNGIAEELSLTFVPVNSNFLEIFNEPARHPANNCGALVTGSAVFAIRKLFKAYLFSSAGELSYFSFDEMDVCQYDLLNLSMISVDGLTFYSTACELTRMERLEYIQKYEIVRKHLSVCSIDNCNRCNKCIRTMGELYSLKSLDDFSHVFNVDEFKRKLWMRLGSNWGDKYEWRHGYNAEIKKKAKENKVHLPLLMYLSSMLIYRPIWIMRRWLSGNIKVRKLYQQLNVDVLLNGEKAYIDR